METVSQLLKRLNIKVSLGTSFSHGAAMIFAYTGKQAERWAEKLKADGCAVRFFFGQGAYIVQFAKEGLQADPE